MKNHTTWDAPTRRTVAILLGILFIYIVYLSRPVLPFLIIAGLIAFILAPVISFLRESLHFPKGLAIATAYLLFIVGVLLFPLIIVPALIDAFSDIQFDPVTVIQLTRQWLITTLQTYRNLHIFGITTDLSPIVDSAEEYLNNITPNQFIPSFEAILAYIPSTIELTWGVATSVFGRLASVGLAILLTLLYSIYLSAGAGNMRRGIFKFVPPAYQSEIAKLGSRILAVWNAYLRGQITLGIIIWLVTWFVGTLIGLPGAFGLGVIAGALEVLPNLGPILAAIPALLVALLQGSQRLPVSNFTFFLIVLGAYILIQQLENNWFAPKILGEAVELSPLTVIVGVVVGFGVGGILGALVAAPVIATGREIVRYAYAKILMQDPYPPEEEKFEPKPSLIEQLKTLWHKLSAWLQALDQKRRASGEEN